MSLNALPPGSVVTPPDSRERGVTPVHRGYRVPLCWWLDGGARACSAFHLEDRGHDRFSHGIVETSSAEIA